MYVYFIGTLLAYLLGSVSTSLIISKIKKVNLRTQGSKNLGASNTLIVLGPKWGIFVGFCDMMKGFISVFVARKCFADYRYLPYIVASAAILGHIFPFYNKFKGGKGFATLIGCILGYNPLVCLIAAVLIVAITLATDYIALATATVAIGFPVFVGISTGNLLYALITAIGSLFILIKHLSNYKRIVNGTEIHFRSAIKKKAN